MQLLATANTTDLDYWLNWRVLLCAIWMFLAMIVSLYIIWKYESLSNLKSDGGEPRQETAHFLCNDDTWKPCLKEIHPLWLLAFRVVAFCLLLTTLTAKFIIYGGGILYYYTQWTFILVTIYFGFGSALSIYGCYQYHKIRSGTLDVRHSRIDAEQGDFMPLSNGESPNALEMKKVLHPQEEFQAPGIISYLFQVIFQMNAGAVMLTDCVYWLIIFPFLTIKNYELTFLTVNMHTINAILLLGDTLLNSLPFPWFRISYFILWTCIFVIFQWTVHAFVSIWWPYPFLDLSSPYAPIWYLSVGLMQVPCYGFFALIVKIKHHLLSEWFPQSYQCLR